MPNEGLRKKILERVKRVVIKVGSGVLTSTDGLNLQIIEGLAGEISSLQNVGYQIVIVSSGAIAAGMKRMNFLERPKNVLLQQATAAVGQGRLVLAYEKSFENYQKKVAQVLLTRDDLTNRRRYLNARNTLLTLIKWKVIPIINENDTVVAEEIKFGDNDNLSALVANLVEADLLINLTDIDGLYDCDPRKNKKARQIYLVEKVDSRIEKFASSAAGNFGLGGMLSKVQAAKKLALSGIYSIIANGKVKNIIGQIFEGKEAGTLFLPNQKRLPKRKYWIVFTFKPKGDILIDDGARKVIVENGKSLLPSGISEVRGKFRIGDSVRCLGTDGEEVAVGLVNYDSLEIARIKGLKTSEIEDRLGYKYYDEIIHRDNLVLV